MEKSFSTKCFFSIFIHDTMNNIAKHCKFFSSFIIEIQINILSHQIAIDVPRMSPLIPLFQQKPVQEIFERILYIWSVRHPASGYVQGINDLVTPFFVVFLSEYISPGEFLNVCIKNI